VSTRSTGTVQEGQRHLPDLEVSLSALETIGRRTAPLLDALTRLQEMDVGSFSHQLRGTFASAPLPPSPDLAGSIQLQSLLHLEEALYRELQTAAPALNTIQKHLEHVFLRQHPVSLITKRAAESLQSLPDEWASLPFSEKLTQYSEALKRFSSVTQNSAQIKELAATYPIIVDETPRVPRDSALWRHALLASELYECSRSSDSKVLHAQFDSLGSHNQLQRQLPPVYEIDVTQLTTALGELTRDPELATKIAHNFLHTVETYQKFRVLIQGRLGFSTSAMQGIEQRLPLAELLQVVEEFCTIDIISGLLRRALVENRPGLGTTDELRAWASEVHSYCSQLSPFERLVPGLSPWQSPELFLTPGHSTVIMENLRNIREDQAGQRAVYRLAASSLMCTTLKLVCAPLSDTMRHYFALVLTYGFGTPAQVAENAKSTFELTTQAYRIYAEDLARVAPHVTIPRIRAAEIEMRLLLDLCLRDGIVKNPLSPQGPLRSCFELSRAVRGAPLWGSVTSLVETLRAGNYAPEQLLSLQTDARRKQAPARPIKQARTGTSKDVSSEKLTSDLAKKLASFEGTLSQLPTLTRDHLIKKHLNVLITTLGQIRNVSAELETKAPAVESHASISTYIDLLKPPHSLGSAQISDFIQIAKTSLHLLRKALPSTSPNQEGT